MKRLSLILSIVWALPAVSADDWAIEAMTAHFMGSNSGLPGGTWPPGTGFNSSLSFNMNLTRQVDGGLEYTDSIVCKANWTADSYPTSWQMCESNGNAAPSYLDVQLFKWRIVNGTYVSPAALSLEFVYPELVNGTVLSVTSSNLTVSNNDLSSGNSYLTCLTSAPLQGVTCTTDGPLSSKHTPIPLDLRNSETDIPQFSVSTLSATPASNPSDLSDCTGSINFTLSSPSQVNCSVQWPCTASEPAPETPYLCTSPEYTWTATPNANTTLFHGFTLSIRNYEVQSVPFSLSLSVDAAKFLSLNNDLEQNKAACMPDGRCALDLIGEPVDLHPTQVLANVN